jgi:dipeptidase E
MRRLLLISSSSVHGSGYLEHCEGAILRHLEGVDRILFVPWALADHTGYAATARARFAELGIALDSIHEAADPVVAVREAAAMFIGGGNTFRLLDTLYRYELLEPIRARVCEGMPYMGASAGTNMTCPTIKTTNDMPIVQPPSFAALGLVPFQINPHYLDPDPDSRHKGETRETRLREFHEENDVPVIGIREGAMLVVDGNAMRLEGTTGARLFRKGSAPKEYPPGAVLDALLQGA